MTVSMAASEGISLCLRNILLLRNVNTLQASSQRYVHPSKTAYLTTTRHSDSAVTQEDEEFRVYEIPGLKVKERTRMKKRRKREPIPPRYHKMKITDDWTSIWPSASTFKYSAIPFPVRQGFIKRLNENHNLGVPPGRYGNAELMKIPNFLHLTPVHVAKHCEAIKKFCTPWPEGLETNEKCKQHFPVEVITSDYCLAGPSVRDARARVVTYKLNASSLNLDYHAKDKLLRLLKDRYNKEDDVITLIADRCPLKKQNYDYLVYILTALYHESQRVEPWEGEKTEADWECYFWDKNISRKNITKLLQRIKEIDDNSVAEEGSKNQQLSYLPADVSQENLVALPQVQDYKKAVTALINEGESDENLKSYKESVKDLLNIKSSISC